MPLKHELAWLVSERCEEIGLTLEKLAQLSGVDITIVRKLLDRAPGAISVSDAECIANAVGLSMGVLGHRRRPGSRGKEAAIVAARTASTSFRDVIPPDALIECLKTGVVAADYRPHIRALLEEAPIGLLARLAHELQDQCGTPPQKTWQKMRTMAAALACLRDIWN